MARTLPTGLAALLQSGFAESHSTLELTVSPLNEPDRTYYLATTPLTINGVLHDGYLRDSDAVRYSLAPSTDRVVVTLENASTIFGADFVGTPDALHGATARFGRYWKDLQTGAEFHRYLLTAVVVGGTAANDAVRITLTSDLYAKTSTGGGRIVSRNCQNKFRDGVNCTYSGVELSCNKLYDDAGGCSGRSNQHQYAGFIYIESKSTTAGAAATPLPAANQSVSDGTTQFLQQPRIDFVGATITNDGTNNKTVVDLTAITPGGTEAVINVKDYGAVGDGTTTDTSAVASAVTAAISSGKPLYFPPGTYKTTLTGLTNGMLIFGAGPTKSILLAPSSAAAVVEVTGASAHTIEFRDLGVQGAGSGSSNHGIYFHDNSFDPYLIRLNRVQVSDCGGKGVYFNGHFTTHMDHVLVTDCGDNAFDFSGNNTNLLTHCYVDNLAANKTAYRVRAGQVILLNCNGVDSLGSGTNWGVFGDLMADDGRDAYCDATLIGCNVESFRNYGVYAKSGSRVSCYNTFFTTYTSGSHVAIKTAFTNNQPGVIDATCRFNLSGTATWANSQAIHGTDTPVLQLGRQHFTQYYNDSGATSLDIPSVAVTSLSSTPNVYTPRYAIDRLTVQTSLAMTGGALGTQTGTIAGALGWTITNSSTNSAAYAGVDLLNNASANGFLRLYASATGIFQVGSDNYQIYIKPEGNNRWYFSNLLFGPLQDNTSDLGAGSGRIKDGYFAGSLNLKNRTAPSAPATGTVVIYAKDKSGTSALYYKNDAGTEIELGATTTSLTSTRVAFGSGSNTLTESADFVYNDSTKALSIGNTGSGTPLLTLKGAGSGTAFVIRTASAAGNQGGLLMPFEGGQNSYGPGIWWVSSASYGSQSGLYLNSGLNWQGASSAHSKWKLRSSTSSSSDGTVNITLDPDNINLLLGTGATSGYLTIAPSNAATNAGVTVARFGVNSTGTAAAGFGPVIEFAAETSTTNDTVMATLSSLWNTATHASRTVDVQVATVLAGGSLTNVGGWVGAQTYGAAEYDNGSVSISVTIDWNKGNHQKLTATGNITTLTFSNITPGAFYVLQIVQDATGGRSVKKPSNMIIPGGADGGGNITGLTGTANAKDELWCRSNGSVVTAFVVADVKN